MARGRKPGSKDSKPRTRRTKAQMQEALAAAGDNTNATPLTAVERT